MITMENYSLWWECPKFIVFGLNKDHQLLLQLRWVTTETPPCNGSVSSPFCWLHRKETSNNSGCLCLSVKVPQILKCVRAGSVENLSYLATFLELAAATFTCAYNHHKGFAFRWTEYYSRQVSLVLEQLSIRDCIFTGRCSLILSIPFEEVPLYYSMGMCYCIGLTSIFICSNFYYFQLMGRELFHSHPSGGAAWPDVCLQQTDCLSPGVSALLCWCCCVPGLWSCHR